MSTTQEIPIAQRRLPVWAAIALGILIAIAGVVLITRPFASIGVLVFTLAAGAILAAVVEFIAWATAEKRTGRWIHLALGAILLLLGGLILAVPGVTVGLATNLFGAALIVLGAIHLYRAFTAREARAALALGGSAAIIFGISALAWPDVTVLAIGALFGVWLLLSGTRLIFAAARKKRFRSLTPPRRTWVRTALSATALVTAVALAFGSARISGTPTPDDFYTAPADVPDQPGELLRAEPFTRAVPDGATAWRILYTTTRDEARPAIASGIVVMPDGIADAPTIAWAHGTTGTAAGCAPSLLKDPFVSGAMPNVEESLANGWAIVAPDYIGLGADAPHPYLVGKPAANSVLDAVRASRQLPDASLGEDIVVWGHSQGGATALSTGGVAPSYAPELNVLGVAAMAPAANLPAMIGELADGAAGTIVGPLVLAEYASHYDDVRVKDYLLPAATLSYQETLSRCWSDSAFLVSALSTVLMDRPIWTKAPSDGPLGARLEQNVPRLPVRAPLLVAQGLTDMLVLPAAQQGYVDELCTSGQALDFRTYEGKDHMGVVTDDSPLLGELMAWTQDRLEGVPSGDTC